MLINHNARLYQTCAFVCNVPNQQQTADPKPKTLRFEISLQCQMFESQQTQCRGCLQIEQWREECFILENIHSKSAKICAMSSGQWSLWYNYKKSIKLFFELSLFWNYVSFLSLWLCCGKIHKVPLFGTISFSLEIFSGVALWKNIVPFCWNYNFLALKFVLGSRFEKIKFLFVGTITFWPWNFHWGRALKKYISFFVGTKFFGFEFFSGVALWKNMVPFLWNQNFLALKFSLGSRFEKRYFLFCWNYNFLALGFSLGLRFEKYTAPFFGAIFFLPWNFLWSRALE